MKTTKLGFLYYCVVLIYIVLFALFIGMRDSFVEYMTDQAARTASLSGSHIFENRVFVLTYDIMVPSTIVTWVLSLLATLFHKRIEVSFLSAIVTAGILSVFMLFIMAGTHRFLPE